ncbi:Isoquinoline 1-oxidoreductase subunit [Paracoccus suum]|uniref:Isoquinoline 1-oxidoreductase subunit n=1 Tax=Paracoccus suum TaxID=2259340 RepID=A0A344PPK3_9RHOB|nr:Isoquinoline 1-oxidoreductase subunit [Paracoccus suum]
MATDLRGPDEITGSDDATRSAAIFEEMGKVLTHPRCLNCHPVTGGPSQGDDMHPHSPAMVRGEADFGPTGLNCNTCHGTENVSFATEPGSIPGHDPWQLAPVSMGWQGVSLRDICEQIKDPARNGGKDLEAIYEHNAHDGLVGWGWDPGEGRTPAPGTQEVFGQLTRTWIDTGAACPG